jgi:succinoglycan biosynthesis protein ExoA
MHKVLLIIPCLNEEAYLNTLVENLVAQTRSINAHIIIVDGGSTDRTIEIVQALEHKHPHISYLHNPQKIQSAAINLAVQAFGDQSTYFIRIDAHADYPTNFCEALLQEAIATEANSIVVSMDTVGKTGFQKAVAAAQNSKLGNGGSAHRNIQQNGQWVDHGHHALMQISAFRAVGGYDETFSHNEDAELDIRFTKAGYRIWLTAKTLLTYYPRSEPRALFRQYFKFGQGRAKTIFKHKIKPRLRQMLPLVVAPAAALFVLFPLCPLFAVPFVGWALICLFYGVFLSRGTKDRDIILSGFAIIIMHLSWSFGFWGIIFKSVPNMIKGSK